MAESIVQVAPDSTGKKLHTISYTVGANTVEDEVVVPGPYPYATYLAVAAAASGAVAGDHLLCLNAGATLKVRVHRIRIRQVAVGAALAAYSFSVLRTTTGAPTGGTAITPAPLDTADAASGAAARSIPTVKGTETTTLLPPALTMLAALAPNATEVWEWRQAPNGKPIIIPAGLTNGLVLKNNTNSAGVTWNVEFEFTETAF